MRTGLASIAAARWALWRPPIAWKKTAPRATTLRSTSSSSVSAGPSTGDPSSRRGGRLRAPRETHMWRMVLRLADYPSGRSQGAEVLKASDHSLLLALFDEHPAPP